MMLGSASCELGWSASSLQPCRHSLKTDRNALTSDGERVPDIWVSSACRCGDNLTLVTSACKHVAVYRIIGPRTTPQSATDQVYDCRACCTVMDILATSKKVQPKPLRAE